LASIVVCSNDCCGITTYGENITCVGTLLVPKVGTPNEEPRRSQHSMYEQQTIATPTFYSRLYYGAPRPWNDCTRQPDPQLLAAFAPTMLEFQDGDDLALENETNREFQHLSQPKKNTGWQIEDW